MDPSDTSETSCEELALFPPPGSLPNSFYRSNVEKSIANYFYPQNSVTDFRPRGGSAPRSYLFPSDSGYMSSSGGQTANPVQIPQYIHPPPYKLVAGAGRMQMQLAGGSSSRAARAKIHRSLSDSKYNPAHSAPAGVFHIRHKTTSRVRTFFLFLPFSSFFFFLSCFNVFITKCLDCWKFFFVLKSNKSFQLKIRFSPIEFKFILNPP